MAASSRSASSSEKRSKPGTSARSRAAAGEAAPLCRVHPHTGGPTRIPATAAGAPVCIVRRMRCGICGSERLTPLGELKAGEHYNDRFQLRFTRTGFFRARPTFEATLARACRDCGALIPFLSDYERRRLDAEGDNLSYDPGN